MPQPQPTSLKQRIRAGMNRARARGSHIGRPRIPIDESRIRTLAAEGLSYSEIAATVQADRMTIYRRLKTA